jgi:serine/threonine protein kinase
MARVRAANTEPIPGYRLLERLGQGGFGEVWKCQAPGGLLKAIKFVHSPDPGAAGVRPVEKELRALNHLRTIRHPFLLSLEGVECLEDELLIVTELAEGNLIDRLQACRREGRAGIPREEVLEYLREAAEVLDLLSQEHGLQHLDVKPHNL